MKSITETKLLKKPAAVLAAVVLTGAIMLPDLIFPIKPAAGHTSGFTYEVMINNYFVDIGANATEFLANELTLIEFNLYPNTDPNNLADFDNVYVTVGDVQAVQLATFVHRPQDMLTVLSYSFPKPGRYEISARFQKGHEELVEVTFPVEVGEEAGKPLDFWVKIGILAVFVALIGIFGVIERRKSGRRPTGGMVDR